MLKGVLKGLLKHNIPYKGCLIPDLPAGRNKLLKHASFNRSRPELNHILSVNLKIERFLSAPQHACLA